MSCLASTANEAFADALSVHGISHKLLSSARRSESRRRARPRSCAGARAQSRIRTCSGVCPASAGNLSPVTLVQSLRWFPAIDANSTGITVRHARCRDRPCAASRGTPLTGSAAITRVSARLAREAAFRAGLERLCPFPSGAGQADEAAADDPCRRYRRANLHRSPLGSHWPGAVSNRGFPDGTARSGSGPSP